jgi:hypothetical protein
MAKNKISEYSSTSAGAGLNTDIASINIDEGCAPSGINNAIRAVMAQLKDFQSGASGDTLPVASGGTGSANATSARSALSAASSGANSDITSLTGLTTALTVAQGGTGASTLTGVVKGSGTSALSAATAGTDFVSPSVATTFSKQQIIGNATLTDGATISWNLADAQVATVTLADNRTFNAPTNMVNGGFYALAVYQDSTGSRTITWNSVFKWAQGTAPILSTAASSKDFFVFRSDGTNLYEQGRSQGVA